jgi:hypothetical protein
MRDLVRDFHRRCSSSPRSRLSPTTPAGGRHTRDRSWRWLTSRLLRGRHPSLQPAAAARRRGRHRRSPGHAVVGGQPRQAWARPARTTALPALHERDPGGAVSTAGERPLGAVLSARRDHGRVGGPVTPVLAVQALNQHFPWGWPRRSGEWNSSHRAGRRWPSSASGSGKTTVGRCGWADRAHFGAIGFGETSSR